MKSVLADLTTADRDSDVNEGKSEGEDINAIEKIASDQYVVISWMIAASR